MTRICASWLARAATQAVGRAISEGGFQAFFVGGCVRDTLLGIPTQDIDIATDAHPDTVVELCTAAGLKVVPTGIEHGTVTVISDGIAHEVTTFRRDIETDGRHARVVFTEHVEEDAQRRDFTMNALYATASGEVLDPLGGMPDLRARRVRFIGDAAQRIHEDFLRILRFFRFHAWYGAPEAGLDREGLAACAANSAGLETLSKERIGAEMKKLLAAPDPAPSVAAMAQSGVLAVVLPGADDRALARLVYLEAEAGAPPDPIRRLACLGAPDSSAKLRLSRQEARKQGLLKAKSGDMTPASELGYRYGTELALDILLLRAAGFEAPLPCSDIEQSRVGARAVFPVNAADLMPRWQGVALGEKLSELETEWIASGFRASKDELLARKPER